MDIMSVCEKVVVTILPYIEDILAVFLFFIIKKLSKNVENFEKEIREEMKFKTQNTADNSKCKQEFDAIQPVYRLNKATNELEKTDEVVDIQEQINSYVETTMQRVLDRLLPSFDSNNDEVVSYNSMTDDLDELNAISQKAEDYKQKFALDPKLSISEVFAVVSDKANLLKEKLTFNEKARELVKDDVRDDLKEKAKEDLKDEEKEIK